jgi:hypothetical protein
MTTPTFISAATGFTTIRFFTAADPYHYTIDNRPLGDLSTNSTTLGAAADAGRRSAMMATLFAAVRNHSAFGVTRYVEGLRITTTTSNATIEPGSIFEATNVSVSDSTSIIKQAAAPATTTLAINSVSLTGSQSVIYAIEAKYTDFDGSTTGYPIYDNTNTSMPSSVLFGKLSLQVVAGAAANTGLQVAPSVTAGWFQLYLVTVTGPSAGPTIADVSYPASPTFNSWGLPTQTPQIFNLGASGTTTVTLGDFVGTTQFANAATSGCLVRVPLMGDEVVSRFNPQKPIKVKIGFAPSVSTNDFVIRLRYAYLAAGTDLSSVSYTTLSNETVTAGTANILKYHTFANTIPGYAGTGKESLRVIVDRIGADGADTNTGNLLLTQLHVYQ